MASDALVQELLDLEQIKRVKARYFRFLDDKDWDGLRAIFLPDIRVTVKDSETTEGAEAFIERAAVMLADARTVHHGHMPDITFDSPTQARAIWLLVDYLEWPPDPETGARRGVQGYWRYHDTYVKVDGDWKIASIRLQALRVDPLPALPAPESDGEAATPDLARFLLTT
jgi:hypothetical protein